MTLETWSCKEVCSVIWFLWVKHVSPIKIHCQLIEVYGNGIINVKHVRKECKEFENCSTIIHNNDRIGQTSTLKMDYQHSTSKKLILESQQVTI
jgi:hypothetical protein